MKFIRIVVSTSGAPRHTRIAVAIDAQSRREERRERAGDELPFAADVPDSCAKRDGHAESRQHQGNGLHQRAAEREGRADRAAEQQRRRRAERREHEHRDRNGEDGEDEASHDTPAMRCATREVASCGVMRSLNMPR
jgi:hypothetical protein